MKENRQIVGRTIITVIFEADGGARMNEEDLEKRIGFFERIKGSAKMYLAAAAIAVCSAYFGGCGEESECCQKLACEQYCDNSPAWNSSRMTCITNSEGKKECCECKSDGSNRVP